MSKEWFKRPARRAWRQHAAFVVAFTLGLAPAAVRAQTLSEEEIEQQGLASQSREGDWNVTLGPGLVARPVYVKPTNLAEHRRDRRKLANQTGKRQSVIIVRERNGNSVPAAPIPKL